MSGPARLAALAVLVAALLPACIVMDVRADDDGSGFRSFGLIGGFADAGWPADDSLLKIGLFEGRSDGTLLYVALWKLVRVEIGLIGLSLGLGPLDAGVGLFFYDPVPPRYVDYECETDGDRCDDPDCAVCNKPPPPPAPETPPAPPKPQP